MRMTRQTASIVLRLSMAAIAPLLLAQEPPHTERINFAPGGTIRIEDAHGDVYVEGWDRPEVAVTILKSMPYGYKPKRPEEATKRLESVSIGTERMSATEVTIATKLPGKTTGSVAIEYEIHVPRDSKLVIHHTVGSVLVMGVVSDIEVTCKRGDIQLMLRDSSVYSIDAATKLGVVTSDFDGTPELRRYRLGERYATASQQPGPHIRLRMGFGGITIKAVQPEGYSIESGK